MLSLLASMGSSLVLVLAGATTPMDQALPPGQTTTIECEYKAKGETYHYKVYIPEGYDKDTTRKYPAMFIFSPGGNADMGRGREWYAKEKWVVIMLVESKNGPWEPIIGNINAAYDDAKERLRIQPGLFFATGLSGGARACSLIANNSPGFAGVILQGAGTARPVTESGLVKKNIAVFMTFGQKDSNMPELTSAKNQLSNKPELFNYEIFDGGHEWAPQEVLIHALEWLKESAYMNAAPGTLPKEVVQDAFTQRNAALDSLTSPVAKADAIDALLRLAGRFGLDKDKDCKEKVADLKKQLADLQKDPAAKKELAARDAYNKARDFEDGARKKIAQTKLGGDALKGALTTIIQAYATVAKQHKDTEYGGKADKKVEDLTKERGG